MSSQRNVRLVGPRGRASDSQKDLIIRFMEEHPFLARRPFDPCPEPMAAEKRRRLWRQLVAEVNAVGPMSKSVDQWQSWWRKQVHDARQQAARRGTGGGYLPRWRVRILNVAGTLPQTGVRDLASEAPEIADEVPNVAVEVVLSEGPAPGEATDSSDVAVPSEDHALPQAWPASRVSVGTAAGTTGLSCEHQYSNVRVGEQAEGGTGFAFVPQQKVCQTKHQDAHSLHHPDDIVTVLRGMKDAAVRQAVALERLANEARQQRDVTERQTAALERLVELHTEELKEIRCIGALAQTISTALQQGTEECE